MLKKFTMASGILLASISSVMAASNDSGSSLAQALESKLNRTVFVQQIEGTQLFYVAYEDNVYFTDSAGSVLISGDVITLSDNVLISNVIKEEIKALYNKQKMIDDSRLESVESFLNGSGKPSALPTKTHENTNTMRAMRLPTQNVDQLPPQTPISPSDIQQQINKAQSEKKSISKQQECLALLKKPNSLNELRQAFYAMSEDDRKQCGKFFAGVKVPYQDDAKYIVYRAENEKDVITMFSDYTCAYCQRDHENISQLNDAGITVRVAPYGRAHYKPVVTKFDGSKAFGEGLSIIGQNYNAVYCGANSPEHRKQLFEKLMSGHRMYQVKALEEAANVPQDGVCTNNLMRDKYEIDLYTTIGTPFYVMSDGSAHRSALTVDEILQRLPK
ncbi:thioredoxin domain-containing protein [Vibrio coralliilyticus]|uniref:thioredoxin fold domain-containing protein n=1 Tax=Vibrio coralliilyticus TaxID=190893 RepID=UPI001E3CDBC7|nr:thioredoxin fold domain-containing protein [Vibrio coralliilyticus]MCC2524935.1 thioredoxin fold domain-containing protein [Vibrio coralliilyticus]